MTAARYALGRARRRHGGSFDTEAEILQTDVMRFMALLGFVLVGIFSLVQAIPLARQSQTPELEQRAQLARELQTLERHIATRRRELAAIRSNIDTAMARREAATAQAAKAREELAHISGQARSLREDLTRRQKALTQVDDALKARRSRLTRLRQRLETQRQALREAERRFATLKTRLQAVQAERAAPEQPRERSAAAESGQGPESTTQPTPEPNDSDTPNTEAAAQAASAQADETAQASADEQVPERGFALKFQSGAALEALVANGEVDVYALVAGRAWQAREGASGLRFQSASSPEEYHEMRPDTVPRAFVEAFRQVAATIKTDSVTWAVGLPAQLSRSIREAIAGKNSGTVVIQQDGSLTVTDGR